MALLACSPVVGADRADLSLAFEPVGPDELIHRGPGFELHVRTHEAELFIGGSSCLRVDARGPGDDPAGLDRIAGRSLRLDARSEALFLGVEQGGVATWRATPDGYVAVSPPGL